MLEEPFMALCFHFLVSLVKKLRNSLEKTEQGNSKEIGARSGRSKI